MNRPPISVLLPTFNCARTVRATLESVKWADEILVADSYSTDATLDICHEYGARVIQHEYINSARQKNWALPQCRYDWVLQIDSDEVLTEELREEIEKAAATAGPEVHAHIEVPGQVATLKSDLLHYDIPAIAKPLGNLDRYTRYEADELKKHGRAFRWHHLLLRPLGAFLYRYLWLQGFRDGWRGLIICGYWGAYVFFTRAKLWELEELQLEKSPR